MLKTSTEKGFELFLKTLAENREQAAERYLALRERLEKFFEWRGVEKTEELTDIVFERITKKIIEGEKIKNAEAFCVTIAKFVLLENRREVLRHKELDENLYEVKESSNNLDSDGNELKAKQLKCLDECLAKLSDEKRKLMIGYFDTDEKTMVQTRKRLAEKIGINLNTLRIRISRMKTKLEECTKECCEK